MRRNVARVRKSPCDLGFMTAGKTERAAGLGRGAEGDHRRV